MLRTVTLLIVCFGLAGFSVPASAASIIETLEKLSADDPDQCTESDTPAQTSPLAIKYQGLKNELAKSIFGEPIFLNSEIGNNYVQGEVYALLETPFEALNETLSQPAQWCEMLILHQNIKTCTYGKNGAGKDQLQLYVGRKHYQKPSDAYLLRYQFRK